MILKSTVSLICLFILFPIIAFGGFDPIVKARESKLYDDRYWEILLHYKKGWFEYRSLVDDPAFFLSENGKYDKQAELYATIEALLAPYSEGNADEHAQCLFPARKEWILNKIPEIIPLLPDVYCSRLDEITNKIKPEKATLIFPFYNLSGPASMFGHTLIRLDSFEGTPLMGYAVTYNAENKDAGIFTYIFKGIFGGFEGKYSVIPYYRKLNEYTAIEYRDIWEYELNLSKQEVFRMYLHIWEMSRVYSYYYFSDENCAFNILFFLEAARPSVNLTDDYLFVTPIDTIRDISNKGLIEKVIFVPSYMKKMESIAGTLSASAIDISKKIAFGEYNPDNIINEPYSDKEKMAILDLSSELVRKRYKEYSESELTDYRIKSLRISRARSLYAGSNEYRINTPANSPEKGHLNSRLSIKSGFFRNKLFYELGFFPTFHSLEDNSKGYVDGAIRLLDINFRLYDSGRVDMDELTIVDILSLNPFGILFKEPSWHFNMGVQNRSLRSDKVKMTEYIKALIGISNTDKNFRLWAMGGFELIKVDGLKGSADIGLISEAGFQVDLEDMGKFISKGYITKYYNKSESYRMQLNAAYAYYPTIDTSVVLDYKWTRDQDEQADEASLSFRLFF